MVFFVSFFLLFRFVQMGCCKTCPSSTLWLNNYCNPCFDQLLENTRKASKPLMDRLANPESGQPLSAHFTKQLRDEEVDPVALVILYYDARLWNVLRENFDVSIDDFITIIWNIQNHVDFRFVCKNVLRDVFHIQK